MAPMGVLTAIVSAIRVCGSPPLRAFIGRAQEGGGAAEAELCSSTSRDVCELYINGGTARVSGRPKILEVMFDPSLEKSPDGKAGIYPLEEFCFGADSGWRDADTKTIKKPGSKDLESQRSNKLEKNSTSPSFSPSPNLSLNIGIKKQPDAVFWAVAIGGFALQTGVLVFAGIITYYLDWKKDGKRQESYACPLVITGTILLCSGMFLCAYLVGQSTKEIKWVKDKESQPLENSSSTPCKQRLCWVQPGGQIVGDQTFDAFALIDDNPQQYMASWKVQSKSEQAKQESLVWLTIFITISGFILQFTGLRGMHSAISLAQLGITVLMSVARAGLRMQRLKPESNRLADCPDKILGHELDWLAMHMGAESIEAELSFEQSDSSSTPPSTPSSTLSFDHGQAVSYLWRFCGTRAKADWPDESGDDSELNPATRVLAYRTRLAELTESSAVTSRNFKIDRVEVRRKSQQLAEAIESSINIIFSTAKINEVLKQKKLMQWSTDCQISQYTGGRHEFLPDHTLCQIYLRLERNDPGALWRLKDRRQLEAVLGLWVWSLKSDPRVNMKDERAEFSTSRAAGIKMQRIVGTGQHVTETDLKMWSGGELHGFTNHRWQCSEENITNENASTIWDLKEKGQPILKRLSDKKDIPFQSTELVRLFGWHMVEVSQTDQSEVLDAWSVPDTSSLLSLCAQDIFGSFLRAAVRSAADDIGRITVQEDDEAANKFTLKNSLSSGIIQAFMQSSLGSRNEALLCVVPAIISTASTSSMLLSVEGALAASRKSAFQYRKRKEWRKAVDVLEWALEVCIKNMNNNAQTTNEEENTQLFEQAYTSLCELYRWAKADGEEEFAVNGIEGMSKYGQTMQLLAAKILKRYSSIVERISGQDWSNSENDDDDGRTQVLLDLTEHKLERADYGNNLITAAKKFWPEVVLALLELATKPDNKDKDERTALSYAAGGGCTQAVRHLLDHGSDPSLEDKKKRSPLSYASERGQVVVAGTLLRDPRASLDFKDTENKTPLWWAASKGHTDIVKQLLETGKVDPNAKDNIDSQTPLSLAISKGYIYIVKLLLDSGKIDLNTEDNNFCQTLLFLTISNGYTDSVKQLLYTGKVDLDAKDGISGQTPLSLAISKGHIDVVKQLLYTGKVDLDAKDGISGQTLLFLAISNGHLDIVKLLLDTGKVDLDAKDTKNGQTPLLLAISKGHIDIVKLLLSTGKVNLDTKDNVDGQTPLWWAAYEGHINIIKLLLNTSTVDLNMEDSNGQKPLQCAAQNGHINIIKLLLDTGRADLGTLVEGIKTPLQWAAYKGNINIVKLILDEGEVDLNKKDNSTITPLWWALYGGHINIIKLLLDTGKVDLSIKNNQGQIPLWWAVFEGHIDIVKLLLDSGKVDPDAEDENGWTPLWQAICKRYIDIIKQLLDTDKVDPDAKDKNGQTPLWQAIYKGHIDIVKQLLDTGKVDPDAKNKNGKTPLSWAAYTGHIGIVKQLLDTGKVNPNAKDENGWTPLLEASLKGHIEIVELLWPYSETSWN